MHRRTLLGIGVSAIVVALLTGVGYQSVPLWHGTALICQNRAELVPAQVQVQATHFVASDYHLLPARIGCTWQVDTGELITTSMYMNIGADLIAAGFLLLGIAALIISLCRRGGTSVI